MKEPSYSLAEAAGLIGVHRNTLSKWISQGCPTEQRADRRRGKEWRIHLPDVIDWLQERAVQDAVGDTTKLDIDEARRRKTAAEAALAELDLAKARNEYVSINVVADVVGEQMSACRSRLLTLPTKIAPMVAPVRGLIECREIIDDAVRECLDELVGYGNAGGDGEAEDAGSPDIGNGSGGSDAAATETEDQPVGRRRKAAKPRGKRGTGKVADQS